MAGFHQKSPPLQRIERIPTVWRIGVVLILLAAIMPWGLAGRPAAAFQETARDLNWQSAEEGRFRYLVEPNEALDAASFAATYGSFAETALTELELFLDTPAPISPIEIHVYLEEASFMAWVGEIGRSELEGIVVHADPRATQIALYYPVFAALTALEAENQIRHATAHLMIGLTTDFNIPRGFDEGFAQYFERPNTPLIARLAALVQMEHQRGELISWSNLNREVPIDDDLLIQAEAYSVVAYLIRHHGLPEFRLFLNNLKDASDWREAMNLTFAPSTSDSIERQWRDDVPRWAAGEWKWNLVAGFDLGPARDQLERGNFEGALTALLISEQLLRDIDDPVRQQEANLLKDQARIGGLAEEKMIEAQQALEHFAYDRAAAAVNQAEEQYAQLPPELRPDDLLLAYHELAFSGLMAADELEIARVQSSNWGDYPAARESALSAGQAFSSLGDETMTMQSQALIDRMDQERLRLVMLLGALAILMMAWLGLWLWARGKSPLRWE
jgi:hypothetical protein